MEPWSSRTLIRRGRQRERNRKIESERDDDIPETADEEAVEVGGYTVITDEPPNVGRK